MERRDFFGACAGAVPATVGAVSLTGRAAEAVKGKAAPLEDLPKIAHRHFIPGKLTCSEAIVMAGCEVLGIEGESACQAALGLAGGVGLQGATCGVFTGSALVLALAIAQTDAGYRDRKKKTFEAAGSFYRRVSEKLGSSRCRDLSGLDLTTEAGRKELMARVKAGTYAGYVRTASEVLVDELRKLRGA